MDTLTTHLALYVPRDPAAVARDCADLLLVGVLVHLVLLFLKHARALRAGAGIVALFALYHAAEPLQLVTFHTTLGVLLPWLGLVLVMVFQHDLRRAIVRLCSRPLFASSGGHVGTWLIDEVVGAASSLAERRIGGLIVLERRRPLEQIGRGTVIDARPTRQLLYSLFVPALENSLHDGAVIIRHGRLWQAGAVLPLSTNPRLDSALGTRHRAGLEASEVTDAVAVVVSEERGEMSLCYSGHLVRHLDAALLRRILLSLLGSRDRQVRSRPSPKRDSAGGSGTVGAGSRSEVA